MKFYYGLYDVIIVVLVSTAYHKDISLIFRHSWYQEMYFAIFYFIVHIIYLLELGAEHI